MRLVSVGLACNNACGFCAQGDLRSAATARDVQGDIERVGEGEEIAFVGGEPTLADELPDWIAECDRRGAARIVVQTNGRRLAYRAWAERLARASSRLALEVSVQGSTAAMHDYHTQVPGSFGQTLRGLAIARALGIPRNLTTVVTRSSFRHLVDIARLAHTLGARALLLAIAAPIGRARRAFERLVPAAEMVQPFLRAAQAEARRLGLSVVIEPGYPFVGLGEVELDASEPVAAGPGSPRVRLSVLGRPQPAVHEARGHERRSGDALREILPALFEAGKS